MKSLRLCWLGLLLAWYNLASGFLIVFNMTGELMVFTVKTLEEVNNKLLLMSGKNISSVHLTFDENVFLNGPIDFQAITYTCPELQVDIFSVYGFVVSKQSRILFTRDSKVKLYFRKTQLKFFDRKRL